MEKLLDQDLDIVNGGVEINYMNMKLSKLQKQFEKACRFKRMGDIMQIASELQARGYYGWAKETAAKYGVATL